MLKRRDMLTIGGLAGVAAVLPLDDTSAAVADVADVPKHDAHHNMHAHLHHPPRVAPATFADAPFTVEMPIAPVLRPVRSDLLTDHYEVDVAASDIEIIPGKLSRMYTYNGGPLNPTIRTRLGRRVKVTYRNKLGEAVNVHLHGGHVAAKDDGHPMDVIPPGGQRTYDYLNLQPASTLWYHDHTHMTESEHVYRGLFGFYIIESPLEKVLGLPDGEFDIPIALRDSKFTDTGELIWDQMDPFSRNTLLANGRQQPYLPVLGRKYRFRLLNASTHRIFRVNIGGAEIVQVGGDGGLLPAPVRRTEILLGPAERADVVIDFRGRQSVTLSDDTGGPLVRFDVVRDVADRSRVPSVLRPMLPSPPATVEREFVMNVDPVTFASQLNYKVFDPARVDTTITEGSTEIWRITNGDATLNLDHTFHIHLVQFRVLDRGEGIPPLPGESGLKDTVYVRPGESVRVQATFSGYTGRYLYHCHMLDHSAFGMMGQMEIVPRS